MALLKHILLLPLYTLALFTTASSFKANPVMGSSFLNRLGLHAVRYSFAHFCAWWRWLFLKWKMPRDLRARYHRDGYVVIENFLPDADFSVLRRECNRVTGDARELSQGDTRTQRILLDQHSLDGNPALTAFKAGPRFQNLLDYAGGCVHPALLYLQRIRNGLSERVMTQKDPQKNIHSDTFHPTMKSWYFLDDVKPEDGPFTYVPGSQRFSWKRLKWEYKKSITVLKRPDGYSEKGSMRAEPADLAAMDLGKPVSLPLPANSLVIANTHGFHCRGQAEGQRGRFELWAMTRLPPFWLLPFMGLRLFRPWQEKAMQAHWRTLDKKNAAKGVPSTWHPIDAKAVTQHDYSKSAE